MLVRITKRYTDSGKIREYVTTLKSEKHLHNYLVHLDACHKIWNDPEVIKHEILEV